jgi:predicted nucleic acid-binding protein
VALARAEGADAIVSGDKHLLELERPRPPVVTARAFVDEVIAVDAASGGTSERD